jgi:hypothetical protein
MRRATAWLLALAVLAATAVGTVPAAASTGSVLAGVNAARAASGLPALQVRGDLSAVAAGWSRQMAASWDLAHNPGLGGQVSGWDLLGENVGYGPDPATVQRAFMNSASHRQNVLEPRFTEIGVAVVTAGDRVWVTQVFRQPRGGSGGAASTGGSSSAAGASNPTSGPAGGTPAATAPPSPEEQLAERVAAARRAARQARQARVSRPGAHRDPLELALGFASAMRTVGG